MIHGSVNISTSVCSSLKYLLTKLHINSDILNECKYNYKKSLHDSCDRTKPSSVWSPSG